MEERLREIRWTEFKLKIFITNYISKKQIKHLYDLYDVFNVEDSYNLELLEFTTNKLILEPMPNKIEALLLAQHFKVPIRHLKRLLNISNRAYYRLMAHYKDDTPLRTYPRITGEEADNVEKFFETLNEIGGFVNCLQYKKNTMK